MLGSVSANNDGAESLFLLLPGGDMVSVSWALEPDNQLSDEAGSFDRQSFGGSLDLPIPISDRFFISTGINYQQSKYTFTDMEIDELKLTALSFPIGAGCLLGSKSLISFTFSPGIFSDFSDTLNSSDWLMQGDCLYARRLSEHFLLMTGLSVGEEFRDVGLYPVLGFTWLMGSRSRLELILPVYANFAYRITDPLKGYMFFTLDGYQYNIEYGENSETTEYDGAVQIIRFGGGFCYTAPLGFSIYLEGGITGGGEFEFRDLLGNKYLERSDPSGFASIRIGYTIQ